jgi:hypothetical protein
LLMLLYMDLVLELKRNTLSDYSNLQWTIKLLRTPIQSNLHITLDTTDFQQWLNTNTKECLEKLNPKTNQMLLNLIPRKHQILSIGDQREQLTQFKTKVNVDHAGLSHQLLLWKELTS